MAYTPKIVSRLERPAQIAQAFPFTETMLRPQAHALLAAYRQAAWQVYQSLPFPTTQEEAWRRTDLRKLKAAEFRLASSSGAAQAIPAELLAPLADSQHGGEIVLSPGTVEVFLAPELAAKGVVFTDLLTAEKEHPDLLARIIGQLVRAEEGKFAALASALAENGVLLYVPRNVSIDQPLHSLYWGAGEKLAHVTHILGWLEDNASATYVHESASPVDAKEQTVHAGVVEVRVGPGANLRFVELQSWGENVWNFTHERGQVERDANLDWIFGAVGSQLTKNFSTLDLAGQGAVGKMSGFYFTDRDQHLDHYTQQNHLAPATTSDLLFKGALLEKSRSVWQGMIYVAPNAPKADGYQANRNLVLSKAARADSIPGLEILTDDVRCTHGATVGRIDQDQVFYLLSRGIPQREAERLIVEGFFEPIMQRIPFEGVRERFQESISRKMDVYTHGES